jgi:hypothetical protein
VHRSTEDLTPSYAQVRVASLRLRRSKAERGLLAWAAACLPGRPLGLAWRWLLAAAAGLLAAVVAIGYIIHHRSTGYLLSAGHAG